MTALSGKSAKDMESMTKDQFKQACGDAEGSRIFSQFAVQKANWKVQKKLKFVTVYQCYCHAVILKNSLICVLKKCFISKLKECFNLTSKLALLIIS